MRGTRIPQEDVVDINNMWQNVIPYLTSPMGLVGVGLALHGVVGFLIALAVDYFYGYDAVNRFSEAWFVLHIAAFRVLKQVGYVLKSPWRSRNARLFEDEFRFEPPTNHEQITETFDRVMGRLGRLARTYRDADLAQRRLKEIGEKDKQKLSDAASSLGWAKDEFWTAHKLAKTFGYAVYRDYMEHTGYYEAILRS